MCPLEKREQFETVDLSKILDMPFRDDNCVTVSHRMLVQKAHELLALENRLRGPVSVDNLTKQTLTLLAHIMHCVRPLNTVLPGSWTPDQYFAYTRGDFSL